jgi:hypothetical protein
MWQRIDLAMLYANTLAGLRETMDGQPPLPVEGIHRMTLDELLAEP